MNWTLHDGKEIALPETPAKASQYLANIFMNGGVDSATQERISWDSIVPAFFNKDTVHTGDIKPLLPATMEILVREPLEPLMTITPLFTRIQAKGLETRVISGAIGAVSAADVGEGQAYPQVSFQIGNGMQTAWIGKSGLEASFTQETLRYSTWDLMSLHLRQIGAAMTRWKEQKAVNVLRTLGTPLFNNLNPTETILGVTTGRDITGAANGTITPDDILAAYAQMSDQGYPPDILLMNPLFYFMNCMDPLMRNMMVNHGGGSMHQMWSGNNGPLDPWSNGSVGAAGFARGNVVNPGGNAAGVAASTVNARAHGMTSAPPLPGYPVPLQVVLSPLVPFDTESKLGDMYLLKSGAVGLHLVDEELVKTEWTDLRDDTVHLRFRERYGFAIAEQGLGIGVFKNVKLARNWFDGTVQWARTSGLSEISATTALDL